MACSCNKKVNTYTSKKIIDQSEDEKTRPFEICPLCAFKHLSYCLALNDPLRIIGELFLACKHLQGNFEDESKTIIDIINRITENQYHIPHFQIRRLTENVHQIALNFKQENDEKQGVKTSNFEELIKDKFTVFVSAANQLFNHETGYEDINFSFVLGLLQLAADNAPDEEKKQIARNAWKLIQSGEKNINLIKYLLD